MNAAPFTPAHTRPRALKIAVQILGFLLSLGLLYWAAQSALAKPGMAEKLPKLLETPAWMLASMVALTMATIAWSGLVFWIVLRPVKALKPADLIAVNAVSTLLGFLPFKLGLVFRVLIHLRKDHLPLLTIMGWLAATGIIILASLSGALAGSWWRGGLDALWWALAIGLPVVLCAAMTLAGKRLLRSKSMRWTDQRPWARNLARALDMLSHPRSVMIALVFRAGDIACHSARFFLASEAARLAGLIDQGLTADQAILAGSTYFLIQALSPFGTLGPREALTIAILGTISQEHFAIVVLVVSAADTAGSILLGGWGLLHLRPLRYVARRTAPPQGAPHAPQA